MPVPETYQLWIWPAGAVACYLVLMLVNPVRPSLRDGLRCLGRYSMIWVILLLFGLCAALFQIGLEVFYHYYLPEEMRPVFQWSRPWFLPDSAQAAILKTSVLPALEGVAGLFNVAVTTFPFSAIAALLFFVNWEGHHTVLFRALRRRFDGWGWFIHLGILLCALAALVKPLLYTPLFTDLGEYLPGLLLLQCGAVIDWLSFLFEIMFGTGVQIYLILMVYAWVRGLNFTHQHLIDFAIRRFSFVMKWSVVVMVASTLLIHLPSILSNIPPFSHWLTADRIPGYIHHTARPIMAALLILFCSVQIVLTFHGESLGRALRDHFHFILKEWWPAGWVLLIAFVHFYFLNVLNAAITTGFGSDTAATLAWCVFYPLLNAFVGGWMLAAWVCLYKRSETGRVRAENWIQY